MSPDRNDIKGAALLISCHYETSKVSMKQFISCFSSHGQRQYRYGDILIQGNKDTSSVHIFSYILEQNSSVFIGFGAELVVMVSE